MAVLDSVEYFQKPGLAPWGSWGKAVATVDASAARVLSWLWLFNAHNRVQDHVAKNGDLLRAEVLTESLRTKFGVGLIKFPGALDNRVFANLWTWAQEPDSSFVLALRSLEDYHDQSSAAAKEVLSLLGSDPGAVVATRAFTRGFYRIMPIADRVCQVTLVQQANFGGLLPAIVMNKRLLSTMKTLARIQHKYERKGRLIDAEIRAVFPSPPPLDQLADEQTAVVEGCRTLEAEDEREWKDLESPSPLVKMWVKYAKPKTGERPIALGKATAVIDCSALTTLASMAAYMSREIVKVNREEGNKARLILESGGHYGCIQEESNPARKVAGRWGQHDYTFATVKTLPFPLNNREFVCRAISTKDANGDFLWVHESVDNTIEVDYGFRSRLVRGIARGLVRITPLGDAACSITLLQYVDAGGVVPVFLINGKIADTLDSAEKLREMFQRDDEIDKAGRDELLASIKEPQTYTVEEGALFERVQGIAKAWLLWDDFEKLKSPDHNVKMGKIFIDDESSGIMRGSVVVDVTVGECATWEVRTRERACASECISTVETLERSELYVSPCTLPPPPSSPINSRPSLVCTHARFAALNTPARSFSSSSRSSNTRFARLQMNAMSREQVRAAGSLERSLTRVNDHNRTYHVVVDLKIPGFQPREFLTSLVWRRQGKALTVVYGSVENDDFPRNPSYIRGTTFAIYEYVL